MLVASEASENGHHGHHGDHHGHHHGHHGQNHHGHHHGHGQHEDQTGAVVAKRGASTSMTRPAANAGVSSASASASPSPQVAQRAEAHKASVGMALKRPEMSHALKRQHVRQNRPSFVENSISSAHPDRNSSLGRVMRNGRVVEVELGTRDER